jgi:hypothetical protein
MNYKKHLAYFDLLGYKSFLENNTPEKVWEILDGGVIARAHHCLSGGICIEKEGKFVPDASKIEINHLMYADTFLFWTDDDSIESLRKLLKVSHDFWKDMFDVFPMRGAIVLDELAGYIGNSKNSQATIATSCIFGKALILGHEIAESQDWAGTIIHESVISALNQTEVNEIIKPIALEYDVPLKNHTNTCCGVNFLRKMTKPSKILVKNLKKMGRYNFTTSQKNYKSSKNWVFKPEIRNEAAWANRKKTIESIFNSFNKNPNSALSVQQKIENTIKYWEKFVE